MILKDLLAALILLIIVVMHGLAMRYLDFSN